MKKSNNLEKIIDQTVEHEVELLKTELADEYKRIKEEMNSRGILFSGITVSAVKNKGNGIIKKHLENTIKSLNSFPFRIKEEYWLKMKEKLEKEIESLGDKYSRALRETLNSLSIPGNFFQDAKNQLDFLAENSIIKSRTKGFESESYYKLASTKLSRWAIAIALISLGLSILMWILK